MLVVKGSRPILLLVLMLTAAHPFTLQGADRRGSRPELLSYEVSDHSPIVKGRQDRAFEKALESTFRKAVFAALGELDSGHRTAQDFATLQAGIFSRAADFIASYRILSQEVKEGYIALSVRADVYRKKLEEAISEAAALAPALPVRILVLIETYPLSGTSGFEDIDAGHLASTALQTELLKRGAVLVPSPERLPWQHLDGRVSAENRISLAAAEGKRLGADFVLLGGLHERADRLLVLTVELVSPSSQKVDATVLSPVELQANTPPGESFTLPAWEVGKALFPRIASRARKTSRRATDAVPPTQAQP